LCSSHTRQSKSIAVFHLLPDSTSTFFPSFSSSIATAACHSHHHHHATAACAQLKLLQQEEAAQNSFR
jgi:hypothetical protein